MGLNHAIYTPCRLYRLYHPFNHQPSHNKVSVSLTHHKLLWNYNYRHIFASRSYVRMIQITWKHLYVVYRGICFWPGAPARYALWRKVYGANEWAIQNIAARYTYLEASYYYCTNIQRNPGNHAGCTKCRCHWGKCCSSAGLVVVDLYSYEVLLQLVVTALLVWGTIPPPLNFKMQQRHPQLHQPAWIVGKVPTQCRCKIKHCAY